MAARAAAETVARRGRAMARASVARGVMAMAAVMREAARVVAARAAVMV